MLRCPTCEKRGVWLCDSTTEVHWRCRYCRWWAFDAGRDTVDVERRAALRVANGDRLEEIGSEQWR